MMKIAILGIAHMHGYSYVRALKRMNDIEITGLFDEDRSRMSTACKELGVKPCEHPEELVAGSDGVIARTRPTGSSSKSLPKPENTFSVKSLSRQAWKTRRR